MAQLTKQLNFVSWSDEAAVQREMGKFRHVGTYDYFSKKKKLKGRKEGRKESVQMVTYLKAEGLNMIQLLNPPTSGLALT